MRSSVKSFLPAALLAASPLLIAAAQSPEPGAMQLSCSLSQSLYHSEDSSSEPNTTAGYIAHPLTSGHAIITTEQEWNAITDARIVVEPGMETLLANSMQNDCNSKEEPSDSAESPTAPANQPADAIPDLSPEAAPTTPTTAPTTAPTPPAEADAAPATTPPSATTAPATTPTTAIPTRTVAPPPPDPTEDPTNVTPTSEPPAPFDGVVAAPLASLPDGVYRYLSGNYEYGIYSNEQIAANGGSFFLLTKTGARVVGTFYAKFSEPLACLEGTVTGDSITGEAHTVSSDTVSSGTEETDTEVSDSKDTESAPDVGESFVPYAGFDNFQVRQPRTVGDRTFYADALLDISEYSRINAGTTLAPSECAVLDEAVLEEAVLEG